MSQSLYHIRVEHLRLLEQIEEQDGEIFKHQEQAFGFTLEAFNEKAVSVGFVTKHLDNAESAIDAEIKRLQSMKKSTASKREWFESQLSGAMHQFGVEKIDTPTLKISFRKSEAVEIEDETKLPESVKEEVPATWKVSKTKIKEAIKRGEEVPGASLVTRKNLQIK